MKKITLYGIILTGIGLLAVGIGIALRTPDSSRSDKLQVTTSFYPLYFLTRQIAGEHATVYNITPAGAEPHDYEPTTQDLARIEDSQLLILHGGQMESWGDDVADNLTGTQTTILRVGEPLMDQTIEEDGESIQDPHVWLSPKKAQQEAAAIAAALQQADPEHAMDYSENLATLQSELDTLDDAYRTGLQNCKDRNIITSHAAFGYLAQAYTLQQYTIAGVSPDAEPSAQDLVELTTFAREHNVSTIFFESLVSPKLAQTIADEIGAQTAVLDPIEGISESEQAAGVNYFTLMRKNLEQLQTTLRCQ